MGSILDLSTRAYGARDVRQEGATRAVTSEPEMRRAIAEIGRKRKPATIVVSQAFTTRAKFIVPTTCPGITITAAGKFPISARGVIDTLFDIRADNVTVRGVESRSPSTSNMFTTFTTSTAGESPSVIDNIPGADRIFVDASGGLAVNALVRGNRQTEVNASHSAPIEIKSLRARIEGNTLTDGGGDAVTIAAGGGDATVIGNDLGGADVTTTASSGGNTVGVNTSPGTLTLHSTDIEVGNPGQANAPVTVVKTATESRSLTAVPAADSTLVFPMAASTTYRFRVTVFFTSPAARSFNYALAGPAAPTVVSIYTAADSGSGVSNYDDVENAYTPTTLMATSDTETSYLSIDGVIENGVNAGDFEFQWAQGVSGLGAAMVLKGSHLEYAVVG
jgi:hypothetical protein